MNWTLKLAFILAALVMLMLAPLIARWWATRHVIRIYFGGGRRPTIDHQTQDIAPPRCICGGPIGAHSCIARPPAPDDARLCTSCKGAGTFAVSGAWEGRTVRPWHCTTCKGLGWLQ